MENKYSSMNVSHQCPIAICKMVGIAEQDCSEHDCGGQDDGIWGMIRTCSGSQGSVFNHT
jgi:hypothetical protein